MSRTVKTFLSRLFSSRSTGAKPRGPRRHWSGLEELEPRVLLSATPFSEFLALDAAGSDADGPVSRLAETRKELVFIDAGVASYEALLDDFLEGESERREIDVIVLESGEDGIAQIGEALEAYQDLDAIHIVSHGDDGSVVLGDTTLSRANLEAYAAAIAEWSVALGTDADLLFYGCNLAASEAGTSLVEGLSELTGADVAASTDLTGHARLGGDWDLEYAVGAIESPLAFGSEARENWLGKLVVINVTTTDDVVSAIDGLTSLREAIIQANGATDLDTINLGRGVYRLTIGGAGENGSATGDLDITEDIIITGADAKSTIINATGLNDRVFHIRNNGGITATISGITVMGGDENNSGGIFVDNSTTLFLSEAIVRDNNSDRGGGLHVHGTANLDGVLFYGNTANDGGAIHFHGADGGSLTNVTISGNTADPGSGEGGGLWTDRTITITNSTIANNTAFDGGGIFNNNAGATVTLKNSILYNPGSTNASGVFVSGDFNIDSDGTAGLGGGNDRVVDPKLVALADNGGPTPTHALHATSLDAIDRAGLTGAPPLDARGVTRDLTPDIGAFEFATLEVKNVDEYRVNDASTDPEVTSGENRGSQQAVAVDASGNYVVVWSRQEIAGNGWEVYARRFDSSGTAITGEILVNENSASNQQQHARVASDGLGNFVVTWTSDQGANPSDIYARRFDASGNPLTNEILVNSTTTGTQKDSGIAMDAFGNFVIVWEGNGVSDADGIYFRQFYADGTALDTSEKRANLTDRGAEINPAVATSGFGQFYITWTVGVDIYFEIFDPDGTSQSLDRQIDTGVTTSSNPDIASDAAGNFSVVYRSDSVGQDGVWGRRFDGAGNTVDPGYFNVSPPDSDHTNPSISMDDLGNFVVTYEGSGDAQGSGVFVRRYDFNLVDQGVGLLVNQTETHAQDRASVAMIGLDNYAIVWTSSDGAQTDVFARQYGSDTLDHALWVSTENDVPSPSGAPGLDSWKYGEIIAFGDPGLALGGSTAGTFSSVFDIDAFTLDGDANIDAIDYVSKHITIGTVNPIDLFAGDLILSTDEDETLGGVLVPQDDLAVFRPDTPGDYSAGTFFYFVNGTGVTDLKDIALVEEATVVGGVNLPAGSFLYAYEGSQDIWHWVPIDPVAGTPGGGTLLIDTSDINIGANNIRGIELIQTTETVGGVPVQAGDLLVSLELDGDIGNPALTITRHDIVLLDVLTAGAATDAQATMFFEGADVFLNTPAEAIFPVALIVPHPAPTADAGGSYAIDEGDSVVLDGSGSTDPDTIVLYEWDLDDDGNYSELGEPTSVNPTVSWATLQSFLINDGSPTGTDYTIRLRVTDDLGQTNVTTTTINVTDTAPTITATGSATADVGSSFTLNLAATDPGDDAISGWTINWGDGTIDTVIGNPASVAHTYGTPVGMTYNILVSATDEDGTHVPGDVIVSSNNTDSLFRFDATTGLFPEEFADLDGLNNPVDVEIGPDGRIYATGFASDDVRRYNATTGAFVDQFATGGLSAASRIAFGPDGNLYVTSYNTDEVLRFNGTTGAPMGAFVTVGSGGLNQPDGIRFGPDGNLYVASDATGEILRYNGTTGAFMGPLPFATVGTTGFTDLQFGPDGNLYVSSVSANRVLRFNGTTGVYIDDFVTVGSGGLNGSAGFVWGPDGDLYVVGFNGNHVLRYDGDDGSFRDIFIASGSGPIQPINLAFTPSHQVTVSLLINDPPVLSVPSTAFINEFHYDNTGIDTGEAIEIAAPAGTDLSGWSLVLYSGFDGSVYHTEALAGIVPDQIDNFGTLVFNFPTDGIQNAGSAPDAIALVDAGGTVVEFLSYEGSFTAVDGPAAGLTTTDIGVFEDAATPVGDSLQLTGLGPGFTWAAAAANTFGAVNTAQSFAAISQLLNQTVLEEGLLVFNLANSNALTVADVDAADSGAMDPMRMTLTVSNGTLTLGSTTGLVNLSGNGTGTVMFDGTIAEVNAALEGLTYQPLLNFNGTDTLNIVADDQGNTGPGGAMSDTADIVIVVNPDNDDPVLTTPGPALDYTENDLATEIDLTATVSDIDSANLNGGTLTVSVSANGTSNDDLEVLPGGNVSLTGFDVRVSGILVGTFAGGLDGADLVITFNGSSTPAAVQEVMRQIAYSNGSENPSTLSRTIDFVLTDGDGGVSNTAQQTVNITADNDRPTATIGPGSFGVDEDDVPRLLGGLSVQDVDAGALDELEVTLTVTDGRLNLTTTTGLSFTGGANNSDTMTFTGTLTNINNALPTLTYRPDPDFAGTDTLTLSVDDQGHTGGAAKNHNDTALVIVSAINDVPVRTAGTVSNLIVGENSGLTTLGLGALAYGPGGGADEAAQTLTYTVTAVTTTLGDIVLSDGTTVVVVSNTYSLAQIQGMQFRAAANMSGGPETFTFTVVDNGGMTNGGVDTLTESLTVTVTPAANTQPTTTGIADVTLDEDSPDTVIDLFAAFADAEDADPALVYTIATNTNPGLFTTTTIDGVAGTLTLDYAPNAHGVADLTVRATDTGALFTETTFRVTLNPVADTPSVTGASTAEETQTTAGLMISRNVNDGIEVTHFKITNIANGSLFQTDGTTAISNGDFITFAEGNAGLKFTPSTDFNGNATFDIQASISNSDPGLGGSVITATIAVSGLADTPSVTNATTLVDTQTTTGLVISRNPADGAEVTHFKITGITNGTLFQNDGTTPISNGDFITFLEASAGLRFTPAPSSTADGSFTAQASIANNDTGLGGGLPTATITVNASNTMPTTTGIADRSVDEDDPPTVIDLFVAFADVEDADASLIYSIEQNDNPALFSETTIDPVAGTLTLGYAEDANGVADFRLRATDTGSLFVEAPFRVTVNPLNDNPEVTANSIEVNEGDAVSIGAATLSATDVDNVSSELTFTITRVPDYGAIFLNGTPLNINDTFTQEDIDNNLLAYEQDEFTLPGTGTEVFDSFAFTVEDSLSGSTPELSLSIVIHPNEVTTPPDPGGDDEPVDDGSDNEDEEDEDTSENDDSGDTITESPPTPEGDDIDEGPPDLIIDLFEPEEPRVILTTPTIVASPEATADDVFVAAPAAAKTTARGESGRTLQTSVERLTFTDTESTELPELARFTSEASPLWEELDSFEEDMGWDQQIKAYVAGSAAFMTISLTVGYVLWITRIGYLLTGFLSTLPAWKLIDPLPILDFSDEKLAGKQGSSRGDDESLESLLDSGNAPRQESSG